jgi:hypothetical protein
MEEKNKKRVQKRIYEPAISGKVRKGVPKKNL